MLDAPSNTADAKPTLSILCPVYNEEHVVPLFWGRIDPVIEELSQTFDVSVVFMDNASTDGTYEAIMSLRETQSNVFVLRMSNNVGYQKSLQTSLLQVESDVYAFIDVDCEDPPEMLLDFAREYKAGFDIVYGIRANRPESETIKFFRRMFYRTVKALADEDTILMMAEFSMFGREVRDAIIQENNSFPFYPIQYRAGGL